MRNFSSIEVDAPQFLMFARKHYPDPVAIRRALALAMMALSDVATRYPDDHDWGWAQVVVRDLKGRMMEQEHALAYQAALELVRRIDEHLTQGRHYRTRSGRLLVHLDQVVEAILRGELAPG